MQTFEAMERRRRAIRIILFVIILGTLPFYCAGFVLWGTARTRSSTDNLTLTPGTPTATMTSTIPGLPTSVPLFLTASLNSPLQPTPLQFFTPIGGGSVFSTATPTLFFIPTSTFAPSLTPFPSNTPVPLPTNTPIPFPTETPISIPTNTPVPLPTDTPVPPPTDTPILPPTDTPIPFDVPTTDPGAGGT